ncbi:MAG TPA: hypothetical protein DEG71_07815 [Clostridiales bacterium]|nr:hypothetical protein [Clostridiales bacterium]
MKNITQIKDNNLKIILDEVTKNMKSLFYDKLDEVILYGSYARNEQDEGSDVDIFVVVDIDEDSINKYKYIIADVMTELSLKYNILISITEVNLSKFNEYKEILPFFNNIKREGIEVYGRKSA